MTVYTVIGDVVAARRITDQIALTAGLGVVIDRVNREVPSLRPLRLVVHDEFHAAYDCAAAAVEASLRLRLGCDDLVLATVDGEDEPVEVRTGIGQGDERVHDDTVSGSAWFHARDARDLAQSLAAKAKWPPSLRTVCRGDDPTLVAGLNAYLLCQDQLLARMDARDRRALLGLLDGRRQVDVAAELGVTQPAIARRVKERGALALHRALESLREIPDPPTTSPVPA